MADRPKTEAGEPALPNPGDAAGMDALKAWFVAEVLPLEADLIQYLSRGGRNRSDVEDLRQDLYMKVCLAAQAELPRVTRPFVFKIARNLLIDRSRRKKSSPTTCYQFDDARDAASCADQSWRIEAADLSHLYRRTVRGMPPKTRRVFLMRRVRRMSYKEIAAALGITVATVDYHLVRALAQCRAAIAEQC